MSRLNMGPSEPKLPMANTLAKLAQLKPTLGGINVGDHLGHCGEDHGSQSESGERGPSNARSADLDKELCKTRIAAFKDALGVIYTKTLTGEAPGKNAGYMKRLQADADLITNRDEALAKKVPISAKDMEIMATNTLAEVTGKLAKHAGNEPHKGRAIEVIDAIVKNMPEIIGRDALKKIFYKDGSRLDANAVVDNMLKHLDEKNSGDKARTNFQDGAILLLQSKKVKALPISMDVDHVDRHNHMGPYAINGDQSKGVANLEWTASQMRPGDKTVHMQIPHYLEGVAARVRVGESHPYYSEGGQKAGYYAKDVEMIKSYNALEQALRTHILPAATGIPVNVDRIPDIEMAAQAYAKNVAAAQLRDGRKNIEIMFGEITGYKPAVPQEMLVKDSTNTLEGKRREFVDGSAKVMEAIYRSSHAGISEALGERQEASLDGVTVKTQVVYHADAMPNEIDFKTGQARDVNSLKEITRVEDISKYIETISSNLAARPLPPLPKGANYECHLQCAHLMGASIDPENYTDPTRATELDKVFSKIEADPNKALKVTSDSSWLTASARAMNLGMGHFFEQAKDPDLKKIGSILKEADNLNNNAFMYMNGAENYVQIKIKKEGYTEQNILDLALARAAQRKALTAYHAKLGEMHEILRKTGVVEKLSQFVEQGRTKDDLVAPGNYIGFAKKHPEALRFGTDNLTPGNMRSGDYKWIQYNSQAAPFELILEHLAASHVSGADTYKGALETFRVGTETDKKFYGFDGEIGTAGMGDGKHNEIADIQTAGPRDYTNSPFGSPIGHVFGLTPGEDSRSKAVNLSEALGSRVVPFTQKSML